MAAAEKEVLEKRGENHRLTAHDARVWPGALFAQRPMWFLGGRLPCRFVVGRGRHMTAGTKQELFNNKP
jgi:hypothetical protein